MAEAAAAGSSAGGMSSAAIGAAGSIGGGILGGLLDFPIQKSFISRQSRHARKFALYMSNTAYQRAVKDLEAAGLNPMLAYTQGGASAASYQPGQAPSLDVDLDVGKAIASAQAAQGMKYEIGRLKAEMESAQSKATYDKYRWNKSGALADVQAIQASADASSASALQGKENQKILEQEKRIREVEATTAESLGKLGSGRTQAVLNLLIRALGGK